MGVINDLLTVEETEHGGETAFERLDFQTAWGISRIITLHSAPGHPPYGVAFEFHDDIAEVDDPLNPKYLRLYQMKTKKSGGWTLAAIGKTGKNPKGSPTPSFAGRMHANLAKFGSLAQKAVFVSNQPLSEAKGAAGEFFLGNSEAKLLKKFIENIKIERSGFCEINDLPKFRFFDCGLHLQTYDRTVIGEIALFLSNEIGGEVDAKKFYLTLGFDCRERSKKMADVTSVGDLIRSKFVTRDSINDNLDRIRSSKISRPQWDSINQRLSLNHGGERKLREAWREYELYKLSMATSNSQRMHEEILSKITLIIENNNDLLSGAVEAAALVRPDLEELLGPRSERFALAAVLYEYFS